MENRKISTTAITSGWAEGQMKTYKARRLAHCLNNIIKTLNMLQLLLIKTKKRFLATKALNSPLI